MENVMMCNVGTSSNGRLSAVRPFIVASPEVWRRRSCLGFYSYGFSEDDTHHLARSHDIDELSVAPQPHELLLTVGQLDSRRRHKCAFLFVRDGVLYINESVYKIRTGFKNQWRPRPIKLASCRRFWWLRGRSMSNETLALRAKSAGYLGD
jgi:hypothetical protein